MDNERDIMERRSWLTPALLGLVVAALASCSGSDSGSSLEDAPSISETTTSASVAASTVPASTEVPETSSPVTEPVAEPATTAATCSVTGDLEPKTSREPFVVSSQVGTDLQLSINPCFEEVIFRQSSLFDDPLNAAGWVVEYVDDPVTLGESGETIDIAGEATLLVRIGTWMPSPEGDGYTGPTEIVPADGGHIVEVRQIANFEGMTTWAIGLDAEYPFTVTVPDGPPRIVIQPQFGDA
jgi:hypothetical protein